jgi:hypothetical protein
MTCLRSAAALAAALLAAGPGTARASTALVATVEELARQSDAVVHGQVERREAWRSADGLRIFTTVEIRVGAAWKGAAPARVTLRVPGGVVGGVGQRVLGAPVFEDGEEVVVFLRASGPAHQVVGLAQGKFAVAAGMAVNDTSGFDLVEKPLPPGERRAAPMPLGELERRVRSTP